MKCDNELINLYIDGQLDGKSRTELEHHLSKCERCSAYYAFLSAYKRGLAGINEVEPPSELLASVLSKATSSGTDRYFYRAPRNNRKTNWRAWGTAAAAVFVAICVGVALIAVDGGSAAKSGENIAERSMTTAESTEAQADSGAVEYSEESAAEAAPDEAYFEEPSAADVRSPETGSATGSGAPEPTSEPAPALSGAEAPVSDNAEMPDALAESSADEPLLLELPGQYFSAVSELFFELDIDIISDDDGIFSCTLPDDASAAALHKLLKKLGMSGYTFYAGQKLEFYVYD